MMDKALITELQDHFDGRGKLKKVANAIKSYSKDASIFFSFVDGWGKKQYVNIPIEPSDILPIIDNYVENIDADILRIVQSKESFQVEFVNLPELTNYVEDYQKRYPSTFTSIEQIKARLEQSYKDRLNNSQFDTNTTYHIEVCSDWKDKLYVFSMSGRNCDIIYFQLDDIYKL